MTTDKNWFTVDRKGLAEIVERRGGLAWLIQELISNGWDEPGVTRVDVLLEPHDGAPYVDVIVRDDAPDGFQDLSHAWTLFAKSAKRGDAEKRGRFNLGEKLVLAFCKEASITTTTGSVIFDQRGRTISNKSRREVGSEFCGTVRMTRDQLAQARKDLMRLIPPATIATTIDGVRLDDREPIAAWREHLWTEMPNAETGALERRLREAEVRAFRPRDGEAPHLYELGIPVVPLDGDLALHVDVRQKVPLNLERDNVTPSYLRDVRVSVLNNARAALAPAELAQTWATDAMASYAVTKEALDDALTARFGKERAGADPSDREAEQRLQGKGHTIVHGGSLPGEVWERVKAHDLVRAAGKISPTPRPYHDGAPKVQTRAPRPGVETMGVARYRAACRLLLGRPIEVVLAEEPQWPVEAVWHQGRDLLLLNAGKLGEWHFCDDAAIYAIAIHEVAHDKVANHLSEEYHDELCRLGGRLAILAASGKLEAAYDDERRASICDPIPF